MADDEIENDFPHLAPERVVEALALGVRDHHDSIRLAKAEKPAFVRQTDQPDTMRWAGAVLSARARLDHEGPGDFRDIGSNTHEIQAIAHRPLGQWGIASFEPPFEHHNVVLIDPDTNVPTVECRALADIAAGKEPSEERHFLDLMEVVARLSNNRGDQLYTDVRSFIVRNPAVPARTMDEFSITNGVHEFFKSIYRQVPSADIHRGRAHRCDHCGSILHRPGGIRDFPDGKCRVSACNLARNRPARFTVIEDPESWRVVNDDILTYWVSPGIDEVRLFDALSATGRDVVLYPSRDRADISIDRIAVGIDVKSYQNPVVLARHLNHSIGGLRYFTRKVVAVPDGRVKLDRGYLSTLRKSCDREDLEFMKVSDAIRKFSR